MNTKANKETASNRPKGRRFQLDPRLAAYKGVWVFIEQERGIAHPVSWELLGEGRKLADMLNVHLGALILGSSQHGLDLLAADASGYGADEVYIYEGSVLNDYRNAPYTCAVSELVQEYKPEIFLLGATTLGRDLAGSVATTIGTGLTADCTELDIDTTNRSMLATRPTFGGSLLCTIQTLNFRPQMATVRPRVMEMPPLNPQRTGKIHRKEFRQDENQILAKVLDFVPDEKREEVNLAYADIIVAGGMGMGNPDNFKLLFDLAEILKAEVGASRPAVQAGWVSADRQIGQTGKTVRPRLYIAAGISGAIQHRVGMEGSDIILAINSDPNAPIFDFADYGIVGDAIQVIPALTEVFRLQRQASTSDSRINHVYPEQEVLS